MKALAETNDRDIFERLVGRNGSKGIQNTFITDRVELLLRTYKGYGIHGKSKTRAYLGEKFRPVLNMPADVSDEAVGTEFLRKIVLPHL
ncbi:DNA-directed RNA polymerase I subunit RPA2, partial [Ascosphaera atra]